MQDRQIIPLLWILQSDLLIRLEQYGLYLITWVGIVTSITYSFDNNNIIEKLKIS